MTKYAHNSPGKQKKAPERLLRSLDLYRGRGELLLSALVSLVEHINTTGGINDLGLTGVEWVRGVRDLDLYEWIGNALDLDGLLRTHT